MFLLNLSPLEFFAIFGAISGVVVTLYLLSRSRRRQRVATLRFWAQAQAPVVSKQRRRIQQPMSLLLQLLSIACLLLAIGQLQWGTPDSASRDRSGGRRIKLGHYLTKWDSYAILLEPKDDQVLARVVPKGDAERFAVIDRYVERVKARWMPLEEYLNLD